MATQILDLEGTFHWAKVFDFNRDMVGYKKNPRAKGAYEDCNGAYSIQVDLTDQSRNLLEKSGSSKELYDRDGTPKQVKFIRKHSVYNASGEEIPAFGGAPAVFKADGVTRWNPEEDGLIGNESKGVVRIEVYELGEGSGEYGTRLKAVQVVDHVAYESDTPRQREEPFKDRSKDTVSDDIPF